MLPTSVSSGLPTPLVPGPGSRSLPQQRSPTRSLDPGGPALGGPSSMPDVSPALTGRPLLGEASRSFPLPPHPLRLSVGQPHLSIPPLQEIGLYQGLTGRRDRGEPPVSN